VNTPAVKAKTRLGKSIMSLHLDHKWPLGKGLKVASHQALDVTEANLLLISPHMSENRGSRSPPQEPQNCRETNGRRLK
jgi:hypothetical protein